jgi:hypothetical protein
VRLRLKIVQVVFNRVYRTGGDSVCMEGSIDLWIMVIGFYDSVSMGCNTRQPKVKLNEICT